MNAGKWLAAGLMAVSVSASAETNCVTQLKAELGYSPQEIATNSNNEVVCYKDKDDKIVVCVYASRLDRSVEQIPGHVQILSSYDIERVGAQDVPSLLEKAANIQIRTMNANPMQSQVAMRGFGENSFGRVKIVLDNSELNSVDMSSPDLTRIPVGSIERLEIIHGPSPVLHGDGATAGVISMTTDTRDYTKKTKIAGKAGSFGTFGLNAQTKGGLEEDGLFYTAAYDYTRSDGYRNDSGYQIHSANGALRKNFENGSDIGLKVNYSNGLYDMPGALTYQQWQDDPKQSVYKNDWCRTWNYGVALDSKIYLGNDQWIYFDGSFDMKHRTSHWGDYGYSNDYDLYSYRIAPRYVNDMWIGEHQNQFTFGFDMGYDLYKVTDRSGWNNPNYKFHRWREALFARDEFYILDNLSVIAGARLENVDNRWKNYKGLKDDHSNDWLQGYELGIVYRPIDNLKTYVKGTRFYRSAFCDEMSYTESGEMLKPETGWSLDAGWEWNFFKECKFDFNAYAMWMKDEIFYNPYARDYGYGYWGGYNENADGNTRRLGFDTGLSWRRDKFAEASIKYSFVSAKFTSGQYDGNEIPLVPMNKLRAEIGYWIFDDLEAKAGYRLVGEQWLSGDYKNEHDKLEAYGLFDIGLYYEPSWAEGWKASFVMDNLLNKKYCDFAGWSDYNGAYYYPGRGTSFQFTLSYEF